MSKRKHMSTADLLALVETARLVGAEYTECCRAIALERATERRLFRAKSAAWLREADR